MTTSKIRNNFTRFLWNANKFFRALRQGELLELWQDASEIIIFDYILISVGDKLRLQSQFLTCLLCREISW